MINIQQILMTNGAGIAILFVLLLLRFETKATKHLGDNLFELMVALSMAALALETVSFLLDNQPGRVVHLLQLLINGYLFLASSALGLIWLLFVDYQIYRSTKRFLQMLRWFALPFLVIAAMVIGDIFGVGSIYSITQDNVYLRGKLMFMPYLVLFFYYVTSFVLAFRAVRKNSHVQYFPIHYFVIPAVVGTIVQGLCYGLAAGWFSASLALVFMRIQLMNQNTFVDDLSGLYNRKYYHYFISRAMDSRKNKTISGIMLDVNHFKSINDQFGHTMGDDAIRTVGRILSEVTTEHDTAFRLAGDEFIIITTDGQEDSPPRLIGAIQERLDAFNAAAEKPYQLSIAMGYCVCDTTSLDSDAFLHRMDLKMYEAKSAYYSHQQRGRRKTDGSSNPGQNQ